MASYLATLAIAEFEVMTDVGPRPRGPRLWARLPIRHYLPPAAAPALVEAVRQTPAMLRFFTDDFIALAEETSGQPLADFFKTWLYTETVPPLPEEFDKMTQ